MLLWGQVWILFLMKFSSIWNPAAPVFGSAIGSHCLHGLCLLLKSWYQSVFHLPDEKKSWYFSVGCLSFHMWPLFFIAFLGVGRERETETLICCSSYFTLISWFLYVLWPRYQTCNPGVLDDTPAKWATWPEQWWPLTSFAVYLNRSHL